MISTISYFLLSGIIFLYLVFLLLQSKAFLKTFYEKAYNEGHEQARKEFLGLANMFKDQQLASEKVDETATK